MNDELLSHLAGVIEGRYFGKYRAKVVDNEDPTGRGRLQVTVPAVLGEQAVWALPCVPYAGPNVGFFALPDKEAGVWVEFEGGEPSFPIWVGCFWARNDIPSEDAKPSVKFLRTVKVKLRIDDEEGSIEITTDGGSSFKLSATEIEQKATAVRAEASGKKTALTSASFDVNDGAFTVA